MKPPRSLRLPPFWPLTLLGLASAGAQAATLTVTEAGGAPLATAMVREVAARPQPLDTSDHGYPAPGVARTVDVDITRFTDAAGRAHWPDRGVAVKYLVRKPGYRDASVEAAPGQAALSVALQRETDPVKLAEAKPANVWLGALALGDAARKRHFQLQCGFCHQQGNAFLRRERTSDEWRDVTKRMVRYGSRLSSDDQKVLPELLSTGWRKLREQPALLPEPAPWDAALAGTTITEWPIGDAMSQTHDQLLARDGQVYVADNIQDRLYQIDPRTNTVTVHKIPHRDGDAPGGLLAARLKDFPRHDSSSNAHSLAQSARDGHIFITPSAQHGWWSSTRRQALSRCTTSAAASTRTPSASTRRTGCGSRSRCRTRSRCSTAPRANSRCTTCPRAGCASGSPCR